MGSQGPDARRRGPRRTFLCVIATVLLLTGGSYGQQPQTGGRLHLWPPRPGPFWVFDRAAQVPDVQVPQTAPPGEPEFVANEVLVLFQPDATGADRVEAHNAVGMVAQRTLRAGDGRVERLTTSLAVADAIAILQTLPQVEFAGPNWIVRHQATSNDPYYTDGSLWGMYGNGTTPANEFGSQAGELWANGFTGSSGVYVGIIDEGIDFNHPDLSANIWTNPFDAVDGVDNDGNGYVDDVHGWDFFNNDNSVYDGSSGNTTLDRHGTHVAGTIGARGGNGTGVAGVNWNVTLISAKFIGPNGGSIADAIEAVDYIRDLKTRHGLNIVATNNSWSGGGYDLSLHQAIIRAAKQNILFIAAAGNGGSDQVSDNNDSVANYPSNYATDIIAGSESAASYEAVVAVASLTSSGALSSFSNFGVTTVDIGAPGSGILSTTPQGGYTSLSGTSMAAPHVTGAIAIYKAMNSAATAKQTRDAILAQGVSTTSLSGKTATGRRLNVGDFTTSLNLTINDVSVTEGNSGTRNSTFTVSLSASSASAITVNYATADDTASAGTTTSNTASISIPSSGNASPYPSGISVAAGLGTVSKLTVVLKTFSHTWPDDVDVLLAGPTGQTVVLMSDVGSNQDANNVTFTFDDAGPALGTGALSSGTFKPTNLGGTSTDTFSSPAPSSPYGTTLSSFNGTDPAGT